MLSSARKRPSYVSSARESNRFFRQNGSPAQLCPPHQKARETSRRWGLNPQLSKGVDWDVTDDADGGGLAISGQLARRCS